MLEAIVKKLKADAPEQRLSLVEWPKWSQPALVVHSGTIMKREWSQSSDEETLVELGHNDIGRK
ncbi:hypothetical protein PTI98_013038 [Pleurotus ostreatus]|nr:hypothetical protein PTI98_013038 [Pleurotus ostreatus]